MKPWEEAVYLDVGFFLPLPLDLEFSSIGTGPDVRWSLLQLGDVYLKFRSLKFACHLGSEEVLVLSLPRRFKRSLCSCMWTKLLQSCLTVWDTWHVASQAPLSMGFSRQEYWSGLPCPPAEESSWTHSSYVFCLAGGFFTTSTTSDSKSEGWEKIENVHLESCSQELEEAGSIQDVVQFTGIFKTLKTMNRIRL